MSLAGIIRRAKNELLWPTVETAAGQTVRYHAATTGEVYEVPAVYAEVEGEQETTEGLAMAWHSQVFRIRRVELPVMPTNLDRIEINTTNEDGTARTEWFQVLSDGTVDGVAPNDNHRDRWELQAKWIPAPQNLQPVYGNAAGDAYGNSQGDAYGGASS